jgi:ribosomal-protein-alanine N-acetyltransferase
MLSSDYADATEIDRLSFHHPWDSEQYNKALRCPHTIGLVAEYGHCIVGVCLYGVHAEHYHLLRLAVHPDCRRAGVGRILVNRLAAKVTPKRPRIVLEIPETQLDGQLFLRRMGFRATEVLREWCGGEDAYAMEYRLDEERVSGRAGA